MLSPEYRTYREGHTRTMAQTPAAFGALLKRYRAAAGLTQEALAERATLSVRGISDLERGVNTNPHKETVQLLADALALSVEDRTHFETAARRRISPLPPSPTDDRMPGSLPASATPLLGRAADIAAICRLLRRPEVRLLTVTGPGGVGKTRLAVQVALDVADGFPDGAFFVSLASLRDPHLALPAIARALGVPDAGDQPQDARLLVHLRRQHVLLLLDNFEHLIAATPSIAALLAACPAVKVLVTSREVLHLSGEHLFAVAPLALPDLRHLPEVVTLARYPAVHLFLQRAQAINADFALTPTNAAAVAEICVRLDGLPLAIELAAARVRLLSPQALLARLDHRLGILTQGARDAPERQRTLRATIEWSHNLLDSPEQALFRRLSLFVGGWTLAAAEAVAASGEGPTIDTLETLASLVDKHLVRATEHAADGSRFTMLETIREYAQERLAADEDAAPHRTHARYVRSLAEQAETRLFGPEQAPWFDRLEREHGNVRAALQWSLACDDGAGAIRLAGALGWFWLIRGYLSEGREWLERSLALNGGTTAERAKAYLAAGMLAWAQGDYSAALNQCAESLAKFRAVQDRHGVALALSHLGRVTLEQGDYAGTLAWSEEAVALFEELRDPWGIVYARVLRGRVAWAGGDYERAIAVFRENIAMVRAQKDQRGIAFNLGYLAGATLSRGDPEGAAAFAAESLTNFQALCDKRGMGYALIFLAGAARERGDYQLAAQHYRECLTLLHDFGPRAEIAWALEECAILHALRGDGIGALQIMGTAAAQRDAIGAFLPPLWQEVMDRRLAPAWQSLDSETRAAAWQRGRTLTVAQVLTEMLDAPG